MACVCVLCHLDNHAELILLTALPWLHTQCTYDTVQWKAVLEQAHPATAEMFPMKAAQAGNYQQP